MRVGRKAVGVLDGGGIDGVNPFAIDEQSRSQRLRNRREC